FLNRIYFGGEGSWQFGKSKSNDQYRTRPSGGNGMVKVGYTIRKNRTFALYPTLGLGGGGTSIRVSKGTRYDDQSPAAKLKPGDNLHSAYMIADVRLNA